MRLIYVLMILVILSSCEQEFTPVLSDSAQKIIVEGHIEKGNEPLPPYVLISRSLPFYGTIDPNDIANAQINDAIVNVDYLGKRYSLQHICLSDIPPELREEIIGGIGIIPSMLESDYCVYIDIAGSIPVETGGIYNLVIELNDGTLLTSETSIPEHVPLNGFRFTKPPGTLDTDTLARLLCQIDDPGDLTNYYRYLTADNNGPFQAGFSSVIDDDFFNGQSFEFPLQKAESPQSEDGSDPSAFGLFERGDTIQIKWMNIDEEHFDFWNTFEFNLNNQGPFSTYTRVSSNVNGALGIWGGYSSTTYTLIVPEE